MSALCQKRTFKIREPKLKTLLKSKPGQREVEARNHRSHWYHPQPTRPKLARPTLGQQHGDKTKQERSDRSSRSPAVPVYRESSEPNGGGGEISGMMCTKKDDAEREGYSKQGKDLRQRNRGKDR